MREVWGKGLCMGKMPPDRSSLCALTVELMSLPVARWSIPQMGGWWVCSHTGLTPCVHSCIFDPKKEFCVMVAVIPKILYRPEEAVYDYWAHKLTLNQQERAYKERAHYCHNHSNYVWSGNSWSRNWNNSFVHAKSRILLFKSSHR